MSFVYMSPIVGMYCGGGEGQRTACVRRSDSPRRRCVAATYLLAEVARRVTQHHGGLANTALAHQHDPAGEGRARGEQLLHELLSLFGRRASTVRRVPRDSLDGGVHCDDCNSCSGAHLLWLLFLRGPCKRVARLLRRLTPPRAARVQQDGCRGRPPRVVRGHPARHARVAHGRGRCGSRDQGALYLAQLVPLQVGPCRVQLPGAPGRASTANAAATCGGA